jgi:hypothetical protein
MVLDIEYNVAILYPKRTELGCSESLLYDIDDGLSARKAGTAAPDVNGIPVRRASIFCACEAVLVLVYYTYPLSSLHSRLPIL